MHRLVPGFVALLWIVSFSVATARPPASTNPASAHWAFQPPARPTPPAVRNQQWPRNAIDHFVLARLEQEQITPSPEADRRTLIRRLSFDLLGLPPSTEQVRMFVDDPRPDAYEHLVDELLASPHFGERWGRHWLDLARYADSDGYEKDSVRPYAYIYRDWVIDAINRDLPFDEFTIEQLAGDLLPGAQDDQKIATGFHRNTLTNKEGGVDQEEFRTKATVDRTSTTGTVWLGLTVGCAECHDHKYDPISQRDFFQLYAFFNDASEFDLPAPTPEEQAQYETKNAAWTDTHSKLKRRLDRHLESQLPVALKQWEQDALLSDEFQVIPDDVLEILWRPAAARTVEQAAVVRKYFRSQVDPVARDLDRKIANHAKSEPKPSPRKAPTLRAQPRETRIHIRGDFLRPGDRVEPGTPSVLTPIQSVRRAEPMPEQSTHSAAEPARLDRLDLARWLVDPSNPLTSRVTVNRIWSRLFGRGIVATPDDFGTRGDPPSHPDLLDWLAAEFPRLGWSRKALVKLILTSSTYRQASNHRHDLAERDPNNLLLARQNRFRLEAEIIRDSFLHAANLLNPEIGGPSIRPPLPADIAALGYANSIKWKPDEGADRYRRGLYILFQRTVPYPMLTTFDAPDSNVTCTRRERSNTPLQALTLLNDPVFFECAQALGRRLAESEMTPGALAAENPNQSLRRAFEICLSRAPTSEELSRLEQLYRDQLRLAQANPENAAQIAGHASPETAALVLVARTILNLDEFFTRE